MLRKPFLKNLIGLGSILLITPQTLLNKNRKIVNVDTNYFEDELVNRASIIAPEEGESLNLNGLSVTFKVTSELSNNQLGVYEITVPPKTIGAKLHYHRFMDETFIVSEGTLTMEVGDQQQEHPISEGTVKC